MNDNITVLSEDHEAKEYDLKSKQFDEDELLCLATANPCQVLKSNAHNRLLNKILKEQQLEPKSLQKTHLFREWLISWKFHDNYDLKQDILQVF